MKRVMILAGVLLVLVAALFVQRQQQKKVIASEPVDIWSVNPDRVTALHIHKSDGESVQLERAAGSWKLTAPVEYAANEQVVTATLRALESLELEDVVSTNPDNRAKYQVDSTGTHVEVKAGQEVLLSAFIGKNSPDYSHTYVRQSDANEVYRAVGVITYNFNKRVDDWRDKTILRLDQQNITRLVLEYPKEKTNAIVARADTTWTVQSGKGEPQGADSLSVANLLRTVSALNTVNFATDEEKAALDFESPDFRLTVETDSETTVLRFVEGESNKYFALREGSDTVFQLFKSALANVLKKADDLRPKES